MAQDASTPPTGVSIAPVSGGGPTQPYEPTEQELADYHRDKAVLSASEALGRSIFSPGLFRKLYGHDEHRA
jgi:hypothetical protein